MIRTNLKTVDGLTIYDLDPLASDLWVIAGPDGHTGPIDPDDLPEGFRWVTEQEWEALQNAVNESPRVEVCTCVEWVRENDFDKDGIEESDLDEATNTYISAVITGLIDKGFEATPAKSQRLFYHGWNGAHFRTRCGCVASWQDLTEEQKTAIAEVRIEAQKKTTADWTFKNLSLSPEPVRFTYEVDGRLSIAGQDAAYGVCMTLEKDIAKDGTLSKEVYEKAANFLNEAYEEDYQKRGRWTAGDIEKLVKNCTFGRWDGVSHCMACNHENISQATSSNWESVCADCGEVLDKVDLKTK